MFRHSSIFASSSQKRSPYLCGRSVRTAHKACELLRNERFCNQVYANLQKFNAMAHVRHIADTGKFYQSNIRKCLKASVFGFDRCRYNLKLDCKNHQSTHFLLQPFKKSNIIIHV